MIADSNGKPAAISSCALTFRYDEAEDSRAAQFGRIPAIRLHFLKSKLTSPVAGFMVASAQEQSRRLVAISIPSAGLLPEFGRYRDTRK